MRTWYISPEGFRELRHSCFLSPKACAEFLGVSLRTVRHWDAGRCRVPWSVVRLLRLYRLGDVGALHDAWTGWVLNSRTGELVGPNGYSFQPHRLAAWPMVCEQARFWRDDRARLAAGGVGALAPARPQAVTLQPEVWEAEVIIDALPSPPPEPLPAEPLLLALGRLLEHADLLAPMLRLLPAERAAAPVGAGGRRNPPPTGAAATSPESIGSGRQKDFRVLPVAPTCEGIGPVSCEAAFRGDSLFLDATAIAALRRWVPTFNKGLKPPEWLQSGGILPPDAISSLPAATTQEGSP